jgi:hypothetical protein
MMRGVVGGIINGEFEPLTTQCEEVGKVVGYSLTGVPCSVWDALVFGQPEASIRH